MAVGTADLGTCLTKVYVRIAEMIFLDVSSVRQFSQPDFWLLTDMKSLNRGSWLFRRMQAYRIRFS